jgi:hypothetical protein
MWLGLWPAALSPALIAGTDNDKVVPHGLFFGGCSRFYSCSCTSFTMVARSFIT